MDAEQKWFSLIVPVYNVDKYLKFCLASIEEQDFYDYELILIDDGSTDNSGAVCDFYASNHKNVKVLHQKNGGLSSARNAGLRLANGKYVIFIDSDDYIAHGTLRKFHDVTEKNPVDIVAAYGYKMIAEGQCVNREDFRKGYDKVVSGQKYYTERLYEGIYSAASVFYITKLSVIHENHLQFEEGLLHEDELWTPKLLCCSDSVLDVKFRFYYYRTTNTTSITRNPLSTRKRAMSRITISHLLKKEYDNNSKYHIPALADNASAQYMYGIYIGDLLHDKEFTVERRFPLQCAKTLKYKLKALLFFVSPELACKLRKRKGR